jgi:hypothetical protein
VKIPTVFIVDGVRVIETILLFLTRLDNFTTEYNDTDMERTYLHERSLINSIIAEERSNNFLLFFGERKLTNLDLGS